MNRRPQTLLSALVLATALAGCGSAATPGASGGGSAGSSSGGLKGTVTVLAAASLKESFSALGRQFEAAHPGTKVVFSFGPSSGLAQQITAGAPADVFASASPKDMATVTSAGDASAPTTFAKNVLEIAVPPSNPARIASLGDLARSGVKVAVCQAQVPCGVVAAKVFAAAKVKVTPVTQEVDVKSVLTKVELGEVDAGLVYSTDVQAAGNKVHGVVIPANVNDSTSYPIAALRGAPNPSAAAAFVAYVLSPAGRAALSGAGFASP